MVACPLGTGRANSSCHLVVVCAGRLFRHGHVRAGIAGFSATGQCGTLSRQRLEDARLAGLADGHEKAIFDHNYQACLKQEAAAR